MIGEILDFVLALLTLGLFVWLCAQPGFGAYQ